MRTMTWFTIRQITPEQTWDPAIKWGLQYTKCCNQISCSWPAWESACFIQHPKGLPDDPAASHDTWIKKDTVETLLCIMASLPCFYSDTLWNHAFFHVPYPNWKYQNEYFCYTDYKYDIRYVGVYPIQCLCDVQICTDYIIYKNAQVRCWSMLNNFAISAPNIVAQTEECLGSLQPTPHPWRATGTTGASNAPWIELGCWTRQIILQYIILYGIPKCIPMRTPNLSKFGIYGSSWYLKRITLQTVLRVFSGSPQSNLTETGTPSPWTAGFNPASFIRHSWAQVK